jgi:hypothetical protein
LKVGKTPKKEKTQKTEFWLQTRSEIRKNKSKTTGTDHKKMAIENIVFFFEIWRIWAYCFFSMKINPLHRWK